jgi:ethanolamine utilization protein EutQ
MDLNDDEARDATVRAGVTLQAAGSPPKSICEYAGRLASSDDGFSVALMRSPAGWTEPTQEPEFREITVVLEGHSWSSYRTGRSTYRRASRSTWRQERPSATRPPEPAVYVAICTPAFSPELAHLEGSTCPESEVMR